jgi:hypothetical protein
MSILILKSKNLPVLSIESNIGQIEGLPKNPRLIKDAKYTKLKKSIEENPEMLGARELIVFPYGDKYVVIGGNMRFQACKELGFKEIPCKLLPATFTPEQLRAITIKDNVSYGELDWEILANEWNAPELNNWGIDVSFPEQENYSLDYKPEVDPKTSYKDVTEQDMENTEQRLTEHYNEDKRAYIDCTCPDCGSEFQIHVYR